MLIGTLRFFQKNAVSRKVVITCSTKVYAFGFTAAQEQTLFRPFASHVSTMDVFLAEKIHKRFNIKANIYILI